jgi:hypothetical protein
MFMSKRELLLSLFQRARNTLGFRSALVGTLLAVLVLIPLAARAQFGLDPCCAIISAGLNSISGLLKSVVGKPLSTIQQLQQQATNFEQQIVYPLNAINSARGLATQMQGQLRQITQIFRLPTNSATLPTPQQLEQALLSRNPQAVSQIGQNYTAVYGAVMAPADAPESVRDLVDMSDAEAQAALKKAVELDALADVELAAADQINQQLQNAAPGSAPILEAQAAAWLVRANAYSQSAMAELIRVRSVDLANASAQLKLSAGQTKTLRNSTDQVLGR